MLTTDQYYLLIPSFIAAVIGSTVQFAYPTPDLVGLTKLQRGASTLGGLTLSLLIAAILLTVFNWNPLIVAVISFFLGLVLEKGIRLFLEYMRASKDYPDFVARGKTAYKITKEFDQTDPKQPESDNQSPVN